MNMSMRVSSLVSTLTRATKRPGARRSNTASLIQMPSVTGSNQLLLLCPVRVADLDVGRDRHDVGDPHLVSGCAHPVRQTLSQLFDLVRVGVEDQLVVDD